MLTVGGLLRNEKKRTTKGVTGVVSSSRKMESVSSSGSRCRSPVATSARLQTSSSSRPSTSGALSTRVADTAGGGIPPGR